MPLRETTDCQPQGINHRFFSASQITVICESTAVLWAKAAERQMRNEGNSRPYILVSQKCIGVHLPLQRRVSWPLICGLCFQAREVGLQTAILAEDFVQSQLCPAAGGLAAQDRG